MEKVTYNEELQEMREIDMQKSGEGIPERAQQMQRP